MSIRRDTVAVVDDDPSLLRAVGRLLTAHGYSAKLFASADELLKAAPAIEAGCFIVDVQLEKDSGVDLAHQLSTMNIKSPVIFMTGSDNDVIKERALEVGCVAYLHKPFSGDQLMDAVDKAIGMRTSAR